MKKIKKIAANELGIPKVKLIKISEIHPAEYNPRIIDTDALEGLAHSIQQFGCIELIVVNVHKNKNTIISWHFHYTVAGGWHQLSEAMNFPELAGVVTDKDVPVRFENVAAEVKAGKQVFVILKGGE
jgi:hypothetical protein